MGGGMNCANGGGQVTRSASSGGSSASMLAGTATANNAATANASAAAAESRAALEVLLPPAERELLRLNEESRTLTNELVDLRFKHYIVDDAHIRLANEVAQLSAVIDRTSSDRAYLEQHGSLPPPEIPGLGENGPRLAPPPK